LLPTQGVYCATGILQGKAENRFSTTLPGLFDHIRVLVEGGYNVYVAPNTFEGHSRRAIDAVWSKSFFIDLDVGPGKHASKAVALEALDAFLDTSGLPPPAVVDSGTGIQAYWVFGEDVRTNEWKPYAEKFKALCLANGLNIDPAVTADAARIMRCPDTYNYKTTPPSPTSVLAEITPYDFGMFKEFLGEVDTVIDNINNDVLASVEKGLDEDTAAFKNLESHFGDLVVKSINGEGCGQIANIIVNAATLPYELWAAGLSIASRCVDAETAIHDMSSDYPGYNREATEAKAHAQWGGPRTCDWFAQNNSSGCEGCKFRGTITSPIQLSKQLQTKPFAEEVGETYPIRVEEDSKKVPLFPGYMKPFYRGAKGGIYCKVMNDDDEEEDILILNHDFFPIRRVIGGAGGESMIMRQIKPHDPMIEFTLPIKQISVLSELPKVMGEIGEVLNSPKQVKLVSDYLKRWVLFFQNKGAAETMRMQMGWTENNDAFIVGAVEIDTNGKEHPAAASPMIKGVSKLFHRLGDYDAWRQAIKVFAAPEFNIHAFAGPLAGLAAPLMRYTSSPGASIGLASGDSGVGKSATLFSALSCWGNPKRQSVMEGKGATDNALISRFLALKNLPLGLDETGNIDPRALSYLIHQVSQGSGKIRMQSSVDAERELQMPASTLLLMSGNRDYNEILQTLKESPKGEMARLIQFNLKRPPQWEDQSEGRKAVGQFMTNYGWAGPEFIKHLYKVSDHHIMGKIDFWLDRFTKDFSKNPAFRFYADVVAACMTAGELASDSNVLHFDLEQIYRSVLTDMATGQEKDFKLDLSDYSQLITEFHYKNIDKFLVFSSDNRCIQEPRGELVGRIQGDTGFFISKNPFKAFLASKQVSEREVVESLERKGVLRGVTRMRLSSGWKTGMGSAPPLYVYSFAPEIFKDLNKHAAP
jgi:hypothetical protein